MAKLEKIQRRATRMLKNIRNWNYEERLHYLNLPPLSYRQFRSDMLTTYQILNDLLMLTLLNFLIYLPPHIPGVTHVNFTKDMQDVMSERDIFLTE